MSDSITRDIALTGIPRSGTTLACRLLNQATNVVALFEPMDVSAVPVAPVSAFVDHTQAYFAAVRQQVRETATAPSKQRHGQVPDNLFAATGHDGHRATQAVPGTITVAVRDDAYSLVIKHNAMFTAVLPALAARIETVAIVRNPLAVLGSWNSVDLHVRNGRAPAGERLDPTLAQRLGAEHDVLERQLILLDWFFARFATHLPRERVLAYEDIVASQGALLFDRMCVRGPAVNALRERNASSAYINTDLDRCAAALRTREGAWQHWYGPDAIASLHARMASDTLR